MSQNILEGLMRDLMPDGVPPELGKVMGAALAQGQSENDEEIRRQAHIVTQTFMTETGRECLYLLMQCTVLRPPGDYEKFPQSAEQWQLMKARRQGQDELFFWILDRLTYGDRHPITTGSNLT